MEIKVNGEPLKLNAGKNGIVDVLDLLQIPQDQPGIAIAVNMELVPRSEWVNTEIGQGDEIEVITARQGG